MRIAVYGAGGIGGYFGGRLAQAGADVHLIARGDHLAALREEGLTVHSVDGDFHVDLPATDDPADVGVCDFVLVCVKSFDTESVAKAADPLVGPDTGLLSLQNGLTNEDVLADRFGSERVLGGVAYVFSTIAEPGVIEHTGGPGSITFGELEGGGSARAERLAALCEEADVEATVVDNVAAALWEKAAFICAQAGTTAAVRLPIGEIRSTEASWELFRRLVEEAVAVGEAAGADLPDGLVERWTAFAEDLEHDALSSLHYDLTNGKPMELEALHGEVVRTASEHGVDAPMHEAVYAVLSPWAERNARDG